MTEDTLLQVLQEELQQSTSWALENIRDDQVKNLQYYLGMPLGNEVKGRSQIVAWEVFEVIESSMPGFMEPFFSSDDIGKFEPRGPEDEAFADQATDYVNYIIKERNEGFLIFNTWIKDALLSKIGVVRAEWCEGEKRRKRFANLTDEQMVMLSQDADTEIIEHSAAPMPGVVGPDGQPFMQHEVVVLQKEAGRVEMECVKPECFLVSRKAASLEKSRILGEWVTYTRSELVEMGFKNAETVDSFDAASAGMLDNELNGLRDNNSTQPIKTSSVDKSLEEVRLFKGYMRCDYDGDGIAEWRRVLIGSGDDPVLENEEATEPNYAVITPIPIPHRIIGTAYADAARPLHELKTSLTRQYLDSLYQANRPRTYVNLDAKVSMDDLLNDRIGGLVRGRGPAADAIQPLQTAAVARDALEGLQLADTMRETRLGIPKFNPGLEADALHKTATGVRSINNLVDKRQKMTLRCMAETGIKRLFKTVLRLTVEYQDRADVVRLRGSISIEHTLAKRGAEKLKAELQRLKSVERPAVITAIAEARAQGDLSENADYDAAKERQGFIEGRIAEIEGKLSAAQVIDPSEVDAGGRVVFGATVELEDEASGDAVTYQIVGEDEADLKHGLINISSPIARALIGKEEGDTAEVQAPGGVRRYEVVAVTYV